MDVLIREYRDGDLRRIQELTVEGFDGTSLEQRIDRLCPGVAPMSWEERKCVEVAADAASHPTGCLVAVLDDEVVGYVTTGVHEARRQGHIANLVVDARLRGHGVGRALIQAALGHFRVLGLRVARIETLADNAVGCHLYPEVGFREIGRKVYFAMPLEGIPTGAPGPTSGAMGPSSLEGAGGPARRRSRPERSARGPGRSAGPRRGAAG